MGILDTLNASAVRLLGVVTVLFGIAVVSWWGVISAALLVVAGVAAYTIGGDPNAQGLIRRTGWFLVYGVLFVVAFGLS